MVPVCRRRTCPFLLIWIRRFEERLRRVGAQIITGVQRWAGSWTSARTASTRFWIMKPQKRWSSPTYGLAASSGSSRSSSCCMWWGEYRCDVGRWTHARQPQGPFWSCSLLTVPGTFVWWGSPTRTTIQSSAPWPPKWKDSPSPTLLTWMPGSGMWQIM